MVSGQQYTNDRIENIFNNNPILECNDTCSCQPALCSNRVVQRGPSPHLTVGEVKGKGWAVFTDRDLHQGEFVCEYAGEVIGEEEARANLSKCSSDQPYMDPQHKQNSKQHSQFVANLHH